MFDIAVIGLGPAGLEIVDIALKNNLKVVAFERNELGGTCLNVGCVPTKSLLHCAKVYKEILNCSKLGIELNKEPNINFSLMLDRKDEIVSKFTKILNSSLSKNITLIKSDAEIYIDDNEPVVVCEDNIYKAKYIVIATGSKPVELNDLKFDSKFILSSDDLYNLRNIPTSITIVGSGAIGLEWAQIFSFLGSNVSIVEKAPCIAPLLDIDIQKRIERILKTNNINFYKNDYIIKANKDEIILNSGARLASQIILSAVGRKPVFPKIFVSGCKEEYKLNIFENCRTEFDNLFVAGDVSGAIMLAHNASSQAHEVMNLILKNKISEHKNIPSVIYITPQIATVGLNEQNIVNKADYKISKVLLSSIAKSWCDESSDGFIKLIIKDNLIKGAHLVCPEASSLVVLLSYFIDNNVEIDKIRQIIFPHPSYGELILEAIKNV